jgi:hypothetical protein
VREHLFSALADCLAFVGSGNVYKLVGEMATRGRKGSLQMPANIADRFRNGVPEDWEALIRASADSWTRCDETEAEAAAAAAAAATDAGATEKQPARPAADSPLIDAAARRKQRANVRATKLQAESDKAAQSPSPSEQTEAADEVGRGKQSKLRILETPNEHDREQQASPQPVSSATVPKPALSRSQAPVPPQAQSKPVVLDLTADDTRPRRIPRKSAAAIAAQNAQRPQQAAPQQDGKSQSQAKTPKASPATQPQATREPAKPAAPARPLSQTTPRKATRNEGEPADSSAKPRSRPKAQAKSKSKPKAKAAAKAKARAKGKSKTSAASSSAPAKESERKSKSNPKPQTQTQTQTQTETQTQTQTQAQPQPPAEDVDSDGQRILRDLVVDQLREAFRREKPTKQAMAGVCGWLRIEELTEVCLVLLTVLTRLSVV